MGAPCRGARLSAGLFDHAIYFDTRVGADCRAGGTAYASLGILHKSVMIAAVIYLRRLKRQHIERAGNNTEIAPLTPFSVDRNRSEYFCHNRNLRLIVKSLFHNNVKCRVADSRNT